MPREVDDKKTRKALRRLARAKRAAENADGKDSDLSEWEDEFLGSLEERLEEYGSAFNDPEKGNLDDALSMRQTQKLREIEKKAKGKDRKPMSRGKGFGGKSGFARKSSPARGRSRDINDDMPDFEADTPIDAAMPEGAESPPIDAERPRASGFKPIVIKGGKRDREG